MKKLIFLMITSALLLVALTGCKPKFSLFGGTTNLSDEEITEINTDAETVDTNNTASAIDDMGVTLDSDSLAPFADQQFKVTFANGVVDADTISAGIVVYELTDTAAADGAYTRGEQLTISDPVVVPDGSGGSSVAGTLDLSGTTVSTQLEVHIIAGTLTANGGMVTLNEDGDSFQGETDEDQDDFYGYITVAGAPVAAAGDPRDPRAALTVVNMSPLIDGGTTIVFDVLNTALGTDRMTVDSLSPGFSFFSQASDGTWTALTPTDTAYNDATGELTFTFDSEFEQGEIYWLNFDLYNIAESESVNGFIHRLSTKNDEDERYYDSFETPEAHDSILVDQADEYAGVTGTVDLTGGHDWTGTNETFDISYNGGTVYTVTLDTNAGDLADVVTDLETAIDTAVGDGTIFTVNTVSGMYVQIVFDDADYIGDDNYFTLAAGDPEDALATLGLAAGTYVGEDAWTYSGTAKEVADGLAVGGDEYSRWVEMHFEGTKVKNASADFIGILEETNNFYITGTEDLSGGYDWEYLDHAEFTVTVEGTQHHVLLDSNEDDLSGVINELNSELPDVIRARSVEDKYVELYATQHLSSVSISYENIWGQDNALPQFGWNAGNFDNNLDIVHLDLSEAAFLQPEDNVIRIVLPAGFQGTSDYRLLIYPGLLDEGATTDATDDILYFNSNWYDEDYGAVKITDWEWSW
ncbi:MAG: hypothetical protein ACLFSE_08265 [Spirochaetia bacterium]